MTDILLGVIVIAVLALVVWLERNHDRERMKFINALIAETAQDHANLQMADQAKVDLGKYSGVLDPTKTTEQLVNALMPDNDLVPMGLASDELFDQAIKNEQEDFDRKVQQDVE